MRVTARSPKRPLHHAPVDKTLILNNLEVSPPDGKGKSYDASGKGKAAATLTSAAEASWSSKNQRGKHDMRDEHLQRRANALRSNSPAAAPHSRSVSLAPEEGKGRKGFRAKKKRAWGRGSGQERK